MSDQSKKTAQMGLFKTLLIIGALVVIAIAIVFWIDASEPEAEREGATKKTAMLVEIETVKRGDYSPQIEGLGMVEAAREITLSPRIEGEIVAISDNFIPGGFVEKGELLVEIDDADFKNAVQQARGDLQRARSELSIEQGRQDVARQEYELVGRELTDKNKDLVLRQPQLEAAKSDVVAAQATLDQALLALERTKIYAPFDAQIIARHVNVGSQVDPSVALADIVGIDEYWLIAAVPVSKLSHIQVPKMQGAVVQKGASVELRNRSAWPQGAVRQGSVKRLIGALDNQTRLARLLVSIPDPLALEANSQGPEILIGSVLNAKITGNRLNNVVRIGRDYLRDGDRVWLMREGELVINEAEVAFKDKDYAYLRAGIEDGDQLVISNLATVAEGIPLRTEQTEAEGVNDQSEAQE